MKRIPWNKGKKGIQKTSEETKNKIREIAKLKGFGKWMKGRKLSEETRKKMSESRKGNKHWLFGKHQLEKTKRKLSEGHKQKGIRPKMIYLAKGDKNRLWKGGITPINERIRKSIEYKLWRTAVFERDKYTCIWCGAKNGNGKTIVLHADHIKPFALFPELRFALDNGRTLCIDCHRKTDTYGRPLKNNK